MRHQLFIGAAVAALVMPMAVQAQQITTGIEGIVTDDAGAPLSGAQVTITDTRTGAERTVTTGASGTFTSTGLVTGGPYTVSASASGFEGQTVQDIVTTLQGNTNLTLALSSGSGDIVVTASRAKLTQLAVGPSQSFGLEVLANAPSFNRDVRDIIRLDPRVSLDRDDSGSGQDRISCLGGNDRGNTFTVDGIPQSDIYGLNDTGFSSRSSTPLPYDAIRETSVQFAPFDVDYGQFTGCAINVVTKSGTNQIKGGGFFEYSDSSLRGKALPGRTVAPIKPEKRWGVSLGGPIIKDRLFIYGAYEHQEAGQSQDDGPTGAGYSNQQVGISATQFNEIRDVLKSQYGIDTGDLVHSRDYTNDRYFGRVDLQINDQHRLEATYQRLEESTIKADDLFTGSSPQAVGANTFYNSGTVSNYYSGRLYSQWSDAFSTELRYSRSEITDRQDPVGGGEAQSDNPIPRIVVGIDNPGNAIDGAVLAGPGTSRSANDLRTKVQQYRAVAKLSMGDHNIKVGAELNRADLFNLFVQNATGTLVFRNVADLRAGLLSPGVRPAGANPPCTAATATTTPVNVVNGCTFGAFGNFSQDGDINSAAAKFDRSIYSIYAQDDWRVNDVLKITAGVRADWYDGGRPEFNPIFLRRYGFGNNSGFSKVDPVILPRVAFTYDFGDTGPFGRAQMHAGVGIFSGGDPLVWFGNAFQNDGSGFGLGTTGSTGTTCPTGQISVLSGGRFTGVPSCIAASGQAQAAASQGSTQSIDPNITMPTVFRANIGFQTELNFGSGFFGNWSLSLDYIYSKYRNPFTLVDLAQAVNPAKGLNGYTIDGRPIYSSIDLLATGCTGRLVNPGVPPVYAGLNTACFSGTRGAELMLTNSEGFRSHNASALLSKNFKGGLITSGGSTYVSFGYAYTDSHDRRSMYNSTAGSNYGQSAAFDRQNPAESTGFFQSKHNITFATNFRNEFFSDLGTSLGFTFVARSGRPYSLTFTGNNVFNPTNGGLTTSDNALAYIPTGLNDPNIAPEVLDNQGNYVSGSRSGAVRDLIGFTNTLDCAKKFSGKSVERNSCTNDWYFDMDLSFSQELPGPGRFFGRDDKIRLYATVDNFLNLLDKSWNVQNRRNFFGVQDIATVSGVDSQGRYIITSAAGVNTFKADNTVNVSSSVWRLKVGVSYDF
ncbi:TonB-dependent receptor [Sphingomonas sp. So64.6b]|uniref:TonB-dependent receptor n=1 Tax=Sphingomonas sp. So64.6b TaxID=2997354 RepID=UPI0016043CC6|nr:TonB-dependent receptor [Sphingomonas sp. So64.6b]QNA82639.1 TonB-dependent receptor [Sphingomonas sp. So64.6b]